LSEAAQIETNLSPEELAELEILEADGNLFDAEVQSAVDARNGMLNFTTYTFPGYEVNWHHRVVCAYLDAFAEGRIKRLMIFMPPRHGKSELVSRRLPAYLLGRNPNEQIIMASYAASLANKMNTDVQRIIDDDRYHYVFPETLILQKGMEFEGPTPKRTSDYFELVKRNHRGYFRSVGVGGGITGMGFSKGIIDDPYKDRAEADSATIRNGVWDWYTSTFTTRMEKDAGICLTQTRWHEDDLAGRLMDRAKNDPNADQWVILMLPALIEDEGDIENVNDKRSVGAALWPDKKSTSDLLKQKALSARDWAALYKQKPVAEGGMILKSHWWRYYVPEGYARPVGKTEDECPSLPRFLDEIALSVDCAFKDFDTSDKVSIQVWGRKGANKYLMDQLVNEQGEPPRLDFVETCKAILGMIQRYPTIRSKWVEAKANGDAVISTFKKKISGMIPVEPEGGKVARARAVSEQIESGNVYLPAPECKPWVHKFIDECAKFPNVKHDDQVDACTQALNKLREHEGEDIRALSAW